MCASILEMSSLILFFGGVQLPLIIKRQNKARYPMSPFTTLLSVFKDYSLAASLLYFSPTPLASFRTISIYIC